MKIVLNKCYGGFRLSEKALARLLSVGSGYYFDTHRTHPELIAVVEALGDAANTGVSNLEIVNIPDNASWIISDYDGIETLYYSNSPIQAI